MIQALSSIVGGLLLLAGAGVVIIFGAALDVLGGSEVARLGLYDLVGALLLALGVVCCLPAFFRTSRRAARFWLEQAAYCALVFGCLLLVYLIAENRSWQWDATRKKLHSLSPQTRRYLATLQTPVEIAAFHAPGQGPDRRRLLEFLQRYQDAAPRAVSVRLLNPITQPFLVRAQYGDDVAPGDVIVTRMGDAATTPGAPGRRFRRLKTIGEEAVTNAIVQVVQGRQVRVYFLQGHGERAIEGKDVRPSERVVRMRAFLEERGYETAALNLLQGAEPEALDREKSIVVCVGPKTDLRAPEREALEDFLDGGGKALFMLDPIGRRGGELAEFRRLLDRYGVEIRRDIVIDTFAFQRFQKLLSYPVVIARYEGHSIADHMSRYTAIMSQARSVRSGEFASPYVTAVEFAFSPEQTSYALDLEELIRSGGAQQGALLAGKTPSAIPLAVASELRRPGVAEDKSAKLVAFGDSDVFTDRLWDQPMEQLIANSLSWLAAGGNMIAVPPKQPEMPRLTIGARQRRALQVFLALLLPFGILFGGMGYTLLRRRLG